MAPGEHMHQGSWSIEVAAPAGVVYGLIADAERWPLFLPPVVHVERLDFDGREDRLHTWSVVDGRIRSWFSRCVQDPSARRVECRQIDPQPPVRTMSGVWRVEERGPAACRLVLQHEFTLLDDRPESAAWAERVVDADSRACLARLKHLAERWPVLDELVLSFEDEVRVNGPAELVHDFLYRAEDWARALAHVERVDLVEDQPGVQRMAMDTRGADGAVHTTESVRVCFPHAGRLVHKQTVTPALVAAHTGEWQVVPDAYGVTVVSQHSVVVRDEAIEQVLGPGADLARARRHLREALGRHSLAVLGLARHRAETAIELLHAA
ncbi:aromatase/cyclase [Streptomyces sp. NPDC050388]|uniref:aromatase/cyclase n=1 Tax=Streptomyces sp. NPDC050388 TaxID=3155781 RepID=UPI00341A994F